MDTTRRRVLQLLGLSAAAMAAPPVFDALASGGPTPAAEPKIGPGKESSADFVRMNVKLAADLRRKEARATLSGKKLDHALEDIDFDVEDVLAQVAARLK